MALPSIPKLSAHGAEIPAVGFGTSSLGDCGEIVATALELGYRHIDTAWKYGTERGVGEGMRASGVPRERHFPEHQGVARISARRRFRALRRREPARISGSTTSTCCWCIGPIRTSRSSETDRRARQGQAARASRAISAWRISTSRCSMRRSALCPEPLVNAASRVSPLSRSAKAHRGLPQARI